MEKKLLLLQLCPLSEFLEAKLAELFTVHKSFDDPANDTWLRQHAGEVRAVATGGHIGIATVLMENLPALGIVAINGVGTDKVDLQVAKARGVRVTTTPNVLTDDVSDLAVGLVIALLRGIVQADSFVREGSWEHGERPLTRKVSGRRFGIVGLGQIGNAIAKRLNAFGPVAYTDLADKGSPFRFVPSLQQLARDSDVLVLASSANGSTQGLVNGEVLDALGPDGYLVNVARGSLIDEVALIGALRDKRIAGAALDVFANEPRVPPDLMKMSNVLLTPHIASATAETREHMARVVVHNLACFLDGTPSPAAVV